MLKCMIFNPFFQLTGASLLSGDFEIQNFAIKLRGDRSNDKRQPEGKANESKEVKNRK